MELKELMTAFAETLGIEGIEVKDGICSMTIDDIPMEFTESTGGEGRGGHSPLRRNCQCMEEACRRNRGERACRSQRPLRADARRLYAGVAFWRHA